MAKKTRYYAVVSGTPVGIFNAWESGAALATQGVGSALYKSFTTLELAVEWYRQNIPQGSPYSSPVFHFKTDNDAPVPPSAAPQPTLAGIDANDYVVFTIVNPENSEPFYVGETKNLERSEARHLGSASRKRKGVSAKIAELLARGRTPVFTIVERCDSKEAALAAKTRFVKLYVQRGLTLCNRTLEHREIQELYHAPAVRLDTVIGDAAFSLGPYPYPSRETLKRGLQDYLGRLSPGLISHRVAIEKLSLLWATAHPEVDAVSFSTVAAQGGARLQAHLADDTVVDFDYMHAIDRIP